MRKQDAGYDYHRYRRLLAEAVDENKRMALIDLLIEERAGSGWKPSAPPTAPP